MRFGASLKKVQHFLRDCYEAVKGSRRERAAMKEQLAGFERLRRASEDEGIAQGGPISDKAVQEIFAGMKRRAQT